MKTLSPEAATELGSCRVVPTVARPGYHREAENRSASEAGQRSQARRARDTKPSTEPDRRRGQQSQLGIGHLLQAGHGALGAPLEAAPSGREPYSDVGAVTTRTADQRRHVPDDVGRRSADPAKRAGRTFEGLVRVLVKSHVDLRRRYFEEPKLGCRRFDLRGWKPCAAETGIRVHWPGSEPRM